MKKLLIFLMALSLFTACKNDKNTTRNDRDTRTNNRDKDDYRNDDKNTDDKQNTNNSNDDKRNSSNNDDRSNDNNSNNNNTSNKSSSWTSGDVNDFTSSCTNSAVEGGMVRTKAQNYCECMQVKLEREYPNPNDAARIDMNSESMKKMVKDCLY